MRHGIVRDVKQIMIRFPLNSSLFGNQPSIWIDLHDPDCWALSIDPGGPVVRELGPKHRLLLALAALWNRPITLNGTGVSKELVQLIVSRFKDARDYAIACAKNSA